MLLYLMHVDWRWIKQRPHFLAEQLGQRRPLTVMHPVNRRRRHLQENPSPLPRHPLLRTIGLRHRGLAGLDAALQRRRVLSVARKVGARALWLTHPMLLDYVPRSLASLPVIYDCMDDALGFPAAPAERARIAAAERALVERAALVLASSERLRQVLLERYPSPALADRVHLVRNGIDDGLLARFGDAASASRARESTSPSRPSGPRLAYVGTVASWFDHDVLHRALAEVPQARLDVFGPCEVTPPAHPQVAFKGVVEHARLPELLAGYDLLIMPFRINDLILGVDPVKLYEYLAAGREVVSVRYPEVERFGPYVHFYEDAASLARILRDTADGRLPRRNEPARVRDFLRDSTWVQRAAQVDALLDRLDA